MFSNGSSSSMSRAIVTPSLVIVGRAELLVEDDVAALGADRHLDRVGEAVDALLERATSGLVEDELLSQCRCPSWRLVGSWIVVAAEA